MRLHIDVQEGDWAFVSYGSYGANVSRALDKLISSKKFDGAAGVSRWLDLDQRMRQGTFEISIHDSDTAAMTVGELTIHCLAEARRLGAARPAPSTVSNSGPAPWINDQVLDVWLSDSATDERLSEHLSVGDLGLIDGDLLVLSIKHPARARYMLASPRNPDELFRWLQLAENSTAPAGGPRLWGVLLYTDADVELATYVRTHFDDLNALSGPATRIFVVERRTNWPNAKKYWRRHLEPELYRVMSTMHWLRWTPYDPQGAYEVADRLGLGPELLPCLVFFRSHSGRRPDGEKMVLRIEQTSMAYFRSLFGAIDRIIRPVTASVQSPAAEEDRRRLERYGPTSDYYRYSSILTGTGEYTPPSDAVQNLLTAGHAADTAAFSAVLAAEEAIRSALRKLAPPAVGLAVNNSLVVISATAGAEVSENFYFQGENTTFINRPQDTVIRDFQNTYATAAHADDLIQLLRLVLTSGNMAAADRDAAAGVIHDLARLGTASEPDLPTARARLERLRTLLASSADIAQPALAILASLTTFFSA